MTEHATDVLAEADRLMTVCNACRYCEGLCAVFPAMELRRSFSDGDLNYLANLCHNCGACYVDCQFSPPHEFDVNVPRTFARVRAESYRRYARPAALGFLFERNGLAVSVLGASGIAAFLLGFVAIDGPSAIVAGTGRFYALMPHAAMAWLFGLVSLAVIAAIAASLGAFWREVGAGGSGAATPASLARAVADAATLRYLDGGGVGCHNEGERPSDTRRISHHLTFYGFLLCFAATATATLYHYAFDLPAPYAWYQLPKLFGIPGGLAILAGTAGLMREKARRDRAMVDGRSVGMDVAFLLMLFLTAATGLLLMVLRGSPAMGSLLALHLGIVLALFLTVPYGKFVHAFLRLAALVVHAHERRRGARLGEG